MGDRDKGNVERALIHAIHAGQDAQDFVVRMLAHNRVIKHNYRYNALRTETCSLEGCSCTYIVALVPRQILYPKYCEGHRSEFRRNLHLRKWNALQKANS